MTQHTLGPWKTKDQWGYIKVHSADKGVCVVHGLDSKSRANANLLAAAPELLAALEAIEARINGVYDCPALVAFGPLHHDTQWDCLRIAEEAINKAKGVSK
jgi:hypothetical protein